MLTPIPDTLIPITTAEADKALEMYDGLMASASGPNVDRAAIRTVAQATAINAIAALLKAQQGPR